MFDPIRDGDLNVIVKALQDRSVQRHDLVAPSSALRMSATGHLVVTEQAHEMSLEGVTTTDTLVAHDLTNVAHGHLIEKLGVPTAYWRRMRETAPDLLATNANYWLAKDNRAHYVRTLRGGEGSTPLCRAILSDRYRPMDDLDILLAALDGINAAGVTATVTGADLTERRMIVRVTAPEVTAAAPDLLDRYRDPRSGRTGRDHPIIHAGLVITNSEVGEGAFRIVPRIVVQVCTNGMTQTMDAQKAVHLGGVLEEGVVQWSDDTHQRNLELVKARTRDAVASFLSPAYLNTAINRLRTLAGHQLTEPATALQVVARGMGYSAAQADAILNAFVAGGDTSALGVAQAVTYVSQDVDDGDTALELEAGALRAPQLAVAA